MVGCGEDEAEEEASASPEFEFFDAPGSGDLRLGVVDYLTNAPIEGAGVTIDGGQLTTDASGHVSVTAKTGRQEVTVSAPGYLEWQHDLPVVGGESGFRAYLAPRAEAQDVDASAGSTITAGEVTIDFPAGAFSEDTEVSATWIEEQSNVMPDSPLFTDEKGQVHEIFGVLHLQAGSEPEAQLNESATIRVPVPRDGYTGEYRQYSIGPDGEWQYPESPTEGSDGYAHFQVGSLFGFLGFGRNLNAAGRSLGSGTTTDSNTVRVTACEGEVLLHKKDDTEPIELCENGVLIKPTPTLGPEDRIETGADGRAELRYPNRARVWMKPEARIKFPPEGESASNWSLLKGRIRSLYRRIPGATTLIECGSCGPRMPTAVAAVRGTVFDFSVGEPCGPKLEFQEMSYAVHEGEVQFTCPYQEFTLVSGKGAKACVDVTGDEPGADAGDPVDAGAGTDAATGSDTGAGGITCEQWCTRGEEEMAAECIDNDGTPGEWNQAGCVSKCECFKEVCADQVDCLEDPDRHACDRLACLDALGADPCDWQMQFECRL
jgi:hypothetical protein